MSGDYNYIVIGFVKSILEHSNFPKTVKMVTVSYLLPLLYCGDYQIASCLSAASLFATCHQKIV